MGDGDHVFQEQIPPLLVVPGGQVVTQASLVLNPLLGQVE